MTSKLRVLIAHGDAAVRSTLAALLDKWGYEPVVAADSEQALAMLQWEDGPRLAVIDWGLEICRQVRGDNWLNYVYVMILTTRTHTQDVVAAMDAGADDYITWPPLHPEELRGRFRAGARIVQLQERLLKSRKELYERATRDGLTGMWNRMTILKILELEFTRARRGAGPLSILMVDLDHFKRINDTHGHLAGDAVLREVARRTSSILRQYDSVGRFGGEEFLVVVPACDFPSSLAVAERLRNVICSEEFLVPDAVLSVTCSVGVACTEFGKAAEVNELLNEADTVLYTAKRKGRNRVEWYGAVDALPADAAEVELARGC